MTRADLSKAPGEVAAMFDGVAERYDLTNDDHDATNGLPGYGVPPTGGGIPGTAPDKLNFSYSVSGSASWKPKRVYSDGVKTYIQFSKSVSSQDAPVLFVVSGGQNRIVNYRLNGTMMVVDFYIDQAILVSGVGSKQQKITIRRGG